MKSNLIGSIGEWNVLEYRTLERLPEVVPICHFMWRPLEEVVKGNTDGIPDVEVPKLRIKRDQYNSCIDSQVQGLVWTREIEEIENKQYLFDLVVKNALGEKMYGRQPMTAL